MRGPGTCRPPSISRRSCCGCRTHEPAAFRRREPRTAAPGPGRARPDRRDGDRWDARRGNARVRFAAAGMGDRSAGGARAQPGPLSARAPHRPSRSGSFWRRWPGASGCGRACRSSLAARTRRPVRWARACVAAGPVSEMAGSSTCLNAAVPEAVADPAGHALSARRAGAVHHRDGINTTGAAMAWVADLLYAPRGRRAGAPDYATAGSRGAALSRRSRWRPRSPSPCRRRTNRSGPARRGHGSLAAPRPRRASPAR